ncbi:cupin domain-containing protein [Kitasatospora gansuensis]
MSVVDLLTTAADLPRAWSSRRLGQVGTATVKVLRMDELPVVAESHGADESLLVLDGHLELELDGTPVTLRAGELCMVPAPRTGSAPAAGARW